MGLPLLFLGRGVELLDRPLRSSAPNVWRTCSNIKIRRLSLGKRIFLSKLSMLHICVIGWSKKDLGVMKHAVVLQDILDLSGFPRFEMYGDVFSNHSSYLELLKFGNALQIDLCKTARESRETVCNTATSHIFLCLLELFPDPFFVWPG